MYKNKMYNRNAITPTNSKSRMNKDHRNVGKLAIHVGVISARKDGERLTIEQTRCQVSTSRCETLAHHKPLFVEALMDIDPIGF